MEFIPSRDLLTLFAAAAANTLCVEKKKKMCTQHMIVSSSLFVCLFVCLFLCSGKYNVNVNLHSLFLVLSCKLVCDGILKVKVALVLQKEWVGLTSADDHGPKVNIIDRRNFEPLKNYA